VLDYQPRPAGLTERQAFALRALARQVMAQLTLRLALAARDQAEAELRRLNETLETRVRQEVAARQAAQARLGHAQRMQALGQLAGGIAHDFNNVLQAISGGMRLIERRLGDPHSVERLIAQINEAADRGAAVTGRLLAFARHEELRAERIDAAVLLAELRDTLTHTIGAGIAVRIEAADDLPPLLADKHQLETVLVNLATNARDAMAGEGTLTLAAAPDQAAEASAHLAPGDYLRISVTDTGAGMDQATLARVTEPFFTTKAAGLGTGLGLAMARGFAEQSGGGMLIASELGRGTTVTLWLPRAATTRP
jgi:signal transduction histidine kinase